jgi:endoglucanase
MKPWKKLREVQRVRVVLVVALVAFAAVAAPQATSKDAGGNLRRTLAAMTMRPSPSPTVTASAKPVPKPTGAAVGATGQGVGGRPMADWQLFVDPVESEAAEQAGEWRATRPADALRMDKMAAQPQSKWIGDWFPDPYQETLRYVGDASAAGKLGVLTIYNLPNRDCGLYSRGGASSDAAYGVWLDRAVQALGQKPVIVVLEPDALAELDCRSAAEQATIYPLLGNAVNSIKRDKNALVYIDAGDAESDTADVIAARLRAANVAGAAGFALNVSSFFTTAQSVAYGNQVSAMTGGKHYIIDTSRNGNGHPGYWCNPPGRALGQSPTLRTRQALADAYLWVKIPGESDGDCGRGEPDPGVWWPDYALQLAINAGY